MSSSKSSGLSPQARRLKYLYNKKYQDAYWERKAELIASASPEERRMYELAGVIKPRTDKQAALPADRPHSESRPVVPKRNHISREQFSDVEEYINALESWNDTLWFMLRRYCKVWGGKATDPTLIQL